MKTYQWSSGMDGGHNVMSTWARNSAYQWLVTIGHSPWLTIYIGVTDDYGNIQPVRKF